MERVYVDIQLKCNVFLCSVNLGLIFAVEQRPPGTEGQVLYTNIPIVLMVPFDETSRAFPIRAIEHGTPKALKLVKCPLLSYSQSNASRKPRDKNTPRRVRHKSASQQTSLILRMSAAATSTKSSGARLRFLGSRQNSCLLQAATPHYSATAQSSNFNRESNSENIHILCTLQTEQSPTTRFALLLTTFRNHAWPALYRRWGQSPTLSLT